MRATRKPNGVGAGLLAVLALLLLITGRAGAQDGALRDLPGIRAQRRAANDDGSTGLIALGFTVNFFGLSYDAVYVNNNGSVTFDTPLAQYTPFGLVSNIGTPIIAAYFADVDTRAGTLTRCGQTTIDGNRAFGVSYECIGYFLQHIDRLNCFQLLLIDRSDIAPGDFDIEFNYGQIEWETGDASGGRGGVGGSSARVGYSNGSGDAGTNFELAGSGTNGAFLDGGARALIRNRYNSDRDGRYVFQVRGGRVENEPTPAASATPRPPTVTPTPTITPPPCFITTIVFAAVRVTSDDSAQVFDRLPYGTRLPVLQQVSGWFSIERAGRVGWVDAGDVRAEGVCGV